MFRKTVDGVLAAFHKTIADLRAVQEDHLDAAETHAETASRFSELAAECRNEADRARRVLERMVEAVK